MSKEEILKIQTCVLKVNIHCDGCKQKVKKILQKIDGVYTTKIDSEQGKVTVSGNVDSSLLIKKLAKAGKHAEICGTQKSNSTQNQPKNIQTENLGKGGQNNKNKNEKSGNGNNNQQPKGFPQLTPQQMQQLQQIKGLQDLKLPPLKDLHKIPNQSNQKAVKLNLPEEDDFTDDDDFEDDDDEFDDDYEFDDDRHGQDKQKALKGNAGPFGPNMMTMKGAANGGGNVKAGGGSGSGEGKNGIGGKKGGGGGNANNQNQGGKGGGGNGGVYLQNGNGGGIANNKNGNGGGGSGSSINGNGGIKGNGAGSGSSGVNDGFRTIGGLHDNMGNMNKPMGQMGNLPMGQTGNMPAVQGLPMNSGSGGGYFNGARPEMMTNNPYQQQQQQQYLAMMNQQRGMVGNERFQPMMYAPQPAAVNYMPQPQPQPYPQYPYPYPPPQSDPYSMFSEENPSSCNVM